MSARVAKVLNKAADLVTERGLNQNGGYYGVRGEVCTLGALRQAIDILRIPSVSGFAEEAIYEQLATDLGEVAPSVTDWNDAPERTADDVVSLLRRAAEAVS